MRLDSTQSSYRLTLSQTPTGKFRVRRAEWDFDFGYQPAVTNDRAVSPLLKSREAAREWAKQYTADHPGCLSASEARERGRA